MLSRQFLTDMCRLSTLAYRDSNFISDLFDNINGNRPHSNEFCVLEQCSTCPTLIQGDLSKEKDIIQNDAQAYASRYQDSLAIVFRGTESFRDVLTDLNMIRVRMDLPGHTGDSRPKVHWGFLRQFRTVEQQVKDHIESYIQDCNKGQETEGDGEGKPEAESDAEDKDTEENQVEKALINQPIKHVVFSGHSLGGALATLVSCAIRQTIS